MQETWVRSLSREDPLEKEMATHSSILAWRIPWREEPGRLQYMGSQRVRHDWAISLHFTCHDISSEECWMGGENPTIWFTEYPSSKRTLLCKKNPACLACKGQFYIAICTHLFIKFTELPGTRPWGANNEHHRQVSCILRAYHPLEEVSNNQIATKWYAYTTW